VSAPSSTLADRVDRLDWARIGHEMDEIGVALAGPVLEADECAALVELYDHPARFRKTVDMARHKFGRGQYRYFADPLPDAVRELRAAWWPHLLPIARQWAERRGRPAPWPDGFGEWIARCHAAGQVRPTPLMLSYVAGDWNALHQDLYGELVFPLQVVIGLDRPVVDYDGGEFVVVEQRPRAQSRATTTVIPQGHAMVVSTRERPVKTATGWATGQMRHGVSTVHRGRRRTLGLIFHDAE
jgi:uncharacterized protein